MEREKGKVRSKARGVCLCSGSSFLAFCVPGQPQIRGLEKTGFNWLSWRGRTQGSLLDPKTHLRAGSPLRETVFCRGELHVRPTKRGLIQAHFQTNPDFAITLFCGHVMRSCTLFRSEPRWCTLPRLAGRSRVPRPWKTKASSMPSPMALTAAFCFPW